LAQPKTGTPFAGGLKNDRDVDAAANPERSMIGVPVFACGETGMTPCF